MYLDYTFAWWRDGFQKGCEQMYFRTGYYGMAFDNKKGGLCKIGHLPGVPEAEAAKEGNASVDALPAVSMEVVAVVEGKACVCTGIEAIDFWGAHSRIIEMGHCTDRIDVMYYTFLGQETLKGRCELTSFPQYATLDFSGFSHVPMPDVGFEIRLKTNMELTSEDADALYLNGANGGLVVLKRGCTVSFSAGTVTAFASGGLVADAFGAGCTIGLIPVSQANRAAAASVLCHEQVKIDAQCLHTRRAVPVEYDPNKGCYTVLTDGLTFGKNMENGLTAGDIDFSKEENRRFCERVAVTFTNNSHSEVLVPVCFYKDQHFPTSGVLPLLRNGVDGEPTGIQVQLSKNWHRLGSDPNNPTFYAAPNDPKRKLEGPWLHAWVNISLAPHQSRTLEYDCLYASWGTCWSASHAQLCLAGWGGAYQLWESSAIGSFGEAFCYDAEVSHGRAFIDDIRPLTVYTKNDVTQREYQWTGCNGGGNFLLYYNQAGMQVPMVRVKVWFKKQGPNLCEVIYRGITQDGAIECEFKANLPRTDDTSRCYHSFSYRFLKDTEFSRLVFYQLGADHYNDNIYPRMAICNDDGPVGFTIDGKQYSGEFTPPIDEVPGYPGGKQQCIEVPGTGLYIACLGAKMTDTNFCKFGPVANRTLVLHAFDADINGVHYDKPSISLYRTLDMEVPCIAAELSAPAAAGQCIRAGSRIEGVVEYINLPLKKEYYYGTSQELRSVPAEEFDTWRLAGRYNKLGKIRATANIGSIVQNVPLVVRCIDDQADVTLEGGFAYVPITFTGLSTQYGFALYVVGDDGETRVDQSLMGNDYWQCYRGQEGYELTFNVPQNGGVYRYRLRKI